MTNKELQRCIGRLKRETNLQEGLIENLQDDNAEKFVNDFVAAWVKVMNADRFDLM